MERREAIAKGHKKYRTGRPCCNGHMGVRYTSTSGCKECLYMGNPVLEAQKKALGKIKALKLARDIDALIGVTT